MADLLQKFLDRRILSIGESDDNFNKLVKAAAELAKGLIAKPEDTAYYTLVALDTEISAEEPRIEQALVLVTKHWKTVVSQSADTPITLLRAVITQALALAIKDSPACAASIWWTSSNYLPYASLNKEEEVWDIVLREAGRITQNQAAKHWSGATVINTTGTTNSEQTPIKAIEAKIKPELISQYLIAAAGPSGGNAGELERNPYNPYSNQSNWVVDFARIAGSGLSGEINRALGILGASLVKITQGQQELSSTIIQQAVKTINQVSASAQSTALRTQLLWWHTAGYSELLNKSYASLVPEIAVLAMVADLHILVPEYTPNSVEAFLERSIQLHITEGKAIKLADWLAEISSIPEVLRTVLGTVKVNNGRRPLLEEVRAALQGNSSALLQTSLGVPDNLTLTLPAIGVWLFRDLQAYRVTRKK
jgi:hypothetical protein